MRKHFFIWIIAILLVVGTSTFIIASAEMKYFVNQLIYGYNNVGYCPTNYNNTYVFDNTGLSTPGVSDTLTDKSNRTVTTSILGSGDYVEAYTQVYSTFLITNDLKYNTDTGTSSAHVVITAPKLYSVKETTHVGIAKENSNLISHLLIGYNN